ncbi:unnamed protein product, partial [Staurois parvus]
QKIGTHQQCDVRPESGTWQSVAMEDSSNGRPITGTHERLGLGSSMREAV